MGKTVSMELKTQESLSTDYGLLNISIFVPNEFDKENGLEKTITLRYENKTECILTDNDVKDIIWFLGKTINEDMSNEDTTNDPYYSPLRR